MVTSADKELEKTMREKAENMVAMLKEDKKKLEYTMGDLLKALQGSRKKLKKISEICQYED